MALDENTYHLIDSFLRGEMKGAELDAFADRMNRDEELRTEVEWMKSMNTAMKESGRKVLKAQIALAMNAIPAASLPRYYPAKNKVSFFKKWWWAITIAVVVSAFAVWYFLPPRHYDELSAPPPLKDTCETCAMLDSMMKPMDVDTGCPDHPYGEASRYDPNTGSLFGADDEGCITRMVKLLSYTNVEFNGDSGTRIAAASTYSWEANSTLSVSFCPKQAKQEYTFGNSLQLYSDYADSTGLRFYMNGADVLMADNKGDVWQFSKTDKLKPFFLMESRGKVGKSYMIVNNHIVDSLRRVGATK